MRNLTDTEFAALLARGCLDAVEPITAKGLAVDAKGAKRGDPRNCQFAKTCQRGDIDVAVLRSITYRAMEATPELIAYNARRGRRIKGLKPGDPVMVKYFNDYRLQEQIRVFDDQKRNFVPGEFTLLVPSNGERASRDKASGSRPKRANARREGKKRLPQLTRVALMRKANTP